MSQKQIDNIVIYYEVCDETDAVMLLEELKSKLPKLFEFFGIGGFSQEKQVYIYDTVNAYKEYKLSTAGYYEDWMIGEQKGNEIRFLSHGECLKTESHEEQTVEEYRKLLIHEFVHACQHERNPEEREETEWFAEALAAVLAEQHSAIPITCAYEDLLYFWENIDYLYETFYSMGAYMINNLPHEAILRYIDEPEMLLRDGEKLFADAVGIYGQYPSQSVL